MIPLWSEWFYLWRVHTSKFATLLNECLKKMRIDIFVTWQMQLKESGVWCFHRFYWKAEFKSWKEISRVPFIEPFQTNLFMKKLLFSTTWSLNPLFITPFLSFHSFKHLYILFSPKCPQKNSADFETLRLWMSALHLQKEYPLHWCTLLQSLTVTHSCCRQTSLNFPVLNHETLKKMLCLQKATRTCQHLSARQFETVQHFQTLFENSGNWNSTRCASGDGIGVSGKKKKLIQRLIKRTLIISLVLKVSRSSVSDVVCTPLHEYNFGKTGISIE